MSTIINATTTNGVVIQPDNSGSLELQSNGTTMASATSSGFNIGGVVASGYTIKNRIINGAMVIDQRNNGASLSLTGSLYTVDRWIYAADVGSKFTFQQNYGAVTPPVGFSKYAGFYVSSAYTPSGNEISVFQQAVEGFNFADLAWGTANAKTITLSFQVYSSLTGTFSGAFRNNGTTRSYPFSYSIPVANTWTSISVTIPGDTSGTWVGATNGVGVYLNFDIGSANGSFRGPANAWATTTGNGYIGVTNSVQVVATAGATWYVTGVQLEIGTSATSFERRLYGQELANCQRYYYCIGGAFNGSVSYQYYSMGFVGTGATDFVGNIIFPVTMRTAPSFAAINPTNFIVFASGGAKLCTSVNQDISSPTNFGLYTVIPAGLVQYQGARLLQDAGNTTQMQFSAEL
jgi:hypothetical protein